MACNPEIQPCSHRPRKLYRNYNFLPAGIPVSIGILETPGLVQEQLSGFLELWLELHKRAVRYTEAHAQPGSNMVIGGLVQQGH